MHKKGPMELSTEPLIVLLIESLMALLIAVFTVPKSY